MRSRGSPPRASPPATPTAPAARCRRRSRRGSPRAMALADAVRARQELRHRGDRRRRPAVDRIGPRPGPSFSSPVVRHDAQASNSGASNDEQSRDEGLFRAEQPAFSARVAAPSVARAQTKRWRMVTSWPKRLPGPGMSAERVAERIQTLSGGRLRDHGPCRGRGRAGVRGARCGRRRRRRDGPHRLVLLAGQDAGGGVLHHGAVRAHARRARRLGRRRRRPGAVGRALRAVRREAVHGRQHRRLHGRLVPPRDQRQRRSSAA